MTDLIHDGHYIKMLYEHLKNVIRVSNPVVSIAPVSSGAVR